MNKTLLNVLFGTCWGLDIKCKVVVEIHIRPYGMDTILVFRSPTEDYQ